MDQIAADLDAHLSIGWTVGRHGQLPGGRLAFARSPGIAIVAVSAGRAISRR